MRRGHARLAARSPVVLQSHSETVEDHVYSRRITEIGMVGNQPAEAVNMTRLARLNAEFKSPSLPKYSFSLAKSTF